MKAEQWGDTPNISSRMLDSKREDNLLRHIQRITNRQQKMKVVKTELSLTFHNLYRMEQARLQAPGPIFIYACANTLLFVRLCGDPRFCKTANFLSPYTFIKTKT